MIFMAWARRSYLCGIMVTLLAFLPQAWFPLMAVKAAAASVLFFLAGVLYTIAWWRRQAEAPPLQGLLLALLPLSYLLSYFLSVNQALGLVGPGLSVDTIFFTTLLAAAGILGSALFRTTADAWLFIRVLLWTTIAAAGFQFAVLAGVPGLFADHSVNLIGKWNDFGLLVGAASFLLLITVEFGHASNRGRVGAWLGLIAGLMLLALVNFSIGWAIVLAVALGVALAVWARSRRFAWSALLASLIAVVFLFFGATLNAELSKIIPVSSLEVRPSVQSTVQVIEKAHGSSAKDAAIGTGPNTFGMSWLAYKPSAVNQSPFWNLDFVVGVSTLTTAFSTVGLLGAVMWVLPLLLVLAALWRMRGTERAMTGWVLAGLVVMMWSAIAFYVPSANLLLVSFALVGVALGALVHGHPRLNARTSGALLALVLVVALGWTCVVSVRRAIAESYSGQSNLALASGKIDDALALAQRSVAIEAMPENLRLLTSADAAKLNSLANATSSNAQEQVATTLKDTITTAQRAIALDPQDYLSYLSLGQFYALLVPAKVAGAYDGSKVAFAKAASLSPLNPTIPLLEAQLEAQGGSVQGLEAALKQSLTLKPDYTDAILFLAQVDIARNDLNSAIRDTQVAAQTAPGVPSIWLELGVLYYAGGDTKDAIAPLEEALKLQPDYANAQYFLGLAYDAQGRAQDALSLFTKLNQTNPGNAQVQAVLANLQAGKPALSTSTPATTR